MSVLCPRCERNHYTPYGEPREPGSPDPPALSRTSREENDAPIYVCSWCGTDEALQQMATGELLPPERWPIRLRPEFGLGARHG